MADRPAIQAGGEDLAFLTVAVCDIDGRVVPTADNFVTFTVEGPGKIIGIGNGNPISHEPFADQQRHAFNGLCLGVLQSGASSGSVTVTVNSAMLQPACITLELL
jgi:beta-galactosidase